MLVHPTLNTLDHVLETVKNARDGWRSLCSVLAKVPSGSKIAIAVSGGGDSLALLWLAKMWMLKEKPPIQSMTALSVHHGWRESAREDLLCVQKHAQEWDVPFVPLYGEKTEPPGSRFQEKARKIRSNLMMAWCLEHDVGSLLTGHHALDQVETFLMRLCRGSGLDGLSAIAPITPILAEAVDAERMRIKTQKMASKGAWLYVSMVRPLLDWDPQTLKNLGKTVGIQPQEDALNRSPKFLRNRMRTIVPLLEKEGLTRHRILETVATLQRTKAYLTVLTLKNAKAYVSMGEWGEWTLAPKGVQNMGKEALWRLLRWMIMEMMGHQHPPRARALSALCDAIEKKHHTGDTWKGVGTLGGCAFSRSQEGAIVMVKEMASLPMISCYPDLPQTWDAQKYRLTWQLDALPIKGSFLKPMGKSLWIVLKTLKNKKDHKQSLQEKEHPERKQTQERKDFPSQFVGSRVPCQVNKHGAVIAIPQNLEMGKTFPTFHLSKNR